MPDPTSRMQSSAGSAPAGNPVQAAGVLLLLALTTKATGFLRVAAIAAILGASAAGDAFLTAFLLPEVLYIWFTEGGMTGAMVRMLTGPRARGALPRLLLGAALAGSALALALAALAPLVAGWLAPGFVPAVQTRAAGHLVTLAPYVPLTLVYFVLQAALNARGHFWGPAVGPLVFNVALLLAAARARGADDDLLVLGVLLGGFLQFLAAALPAAWLLRGAPEAAPTDSPGLAPRLGSLVLPTAALVGVLQAQFVLERVLLSGAATGTVTRFATAQKFVVLPLGLIAVNLATALMPYLARRFDDAGEDGLGEGLAVGLRTLVWVMVPLTFLTAAGALPVVELVFGRGQFTGADLVETARLVEVAAPATVGMAVTLFLTRGYLAVGDARTPALLKAATVSALLFLDALAVGPFGARALFLLGGVAALIEAVLLVGRLPGAGAGASRRVLGLLARAALAGGALFLAFRAVGTGALPPGSGSVERLLALVPPSLAGLGAFAVAAAFLGAPRPDRLLAELRVLRRGPGPGSPPAASGGGGGRG